MFVDFKEYILDDKSNARQALQKLDALSSKDSRTLFIINEEGRLLGTITDGDIRRGLLSGREISENVNLYMNRKFKFLREDQINADEVKLYKGLKIHLLPVLDTMERVIKLIDLKQVQAIVPISALIMAGGRGERLRPLTDATPKPMLKVGDKPIIEHNIDRLIKYGVEDFYISIKYLGKNIQDYFGDGKSKSVKIKYIEEDEPLGTIGAFRLAPQIRHEHILVMNSDILTTLDFEDFYKHFLSVNADMCVASVPYSVNIPYGVLELSDDLHVTSLKEKPTYVYYSNAGIYLLKSKLRDLIPAQGMYNATDLMDDLIRKSRKVVNFPILNYWLDIGNQQDFLKAQMDIKHLEL